MSANKEIQQLKQMTREAHEAIQELHALLKQVQQLQAEVLVTASIVFKEQIEKQVSDSLEAYQDSMLKAVETGTQAVYDRFDKLGNILLGETKTARRSGKSIPDLIRKGKPNG